MLGRMLREEVRFARLAEDWRSALKLMVDAVILYRLMKFVRFPNRTRRVRVKPGVTLIYRLERGDLASVREVWEEEMYVVPHDITGETVVDLGGNIGMATLFFARRLGAGRLIVVEPLPANVELLERNLAVNGIEATIVQAAICATDGTARFSTDRASNLNSLADEGIEVRVVSMGSLLAGLERVAVVKVDIEGAERETLLEASTGWLDRVATLVMELHPGVSEEHVSRIVTRHGLHSNGMQTRPEMLLFARDQPGTG
jgi:FkbM family methyltransferase